ncbi:YdgA family protein [Desulfomicrobium salsuginis]
MKRLFVLLLVFAAGAYAAAAYLLGGQAREQYFSLLKEHERSGLVSLTNQYYERGFLASRAATLVEVAFPGAEQGGVAAKTVRFTLRHELRHGPMPDLFDGFSFDTALATMKSVVEPVDSGDDVGKLFAEIPELAQSRSTLRVGFSGEIKGDLTVPAFEKSGGEGERLTWGGLTLNIVHEPMTGAVRGDFSLPGLSMAADRGRVALDGLTGTFDLVEALPYLYVGRADGAVASINMTQPGAESVLVTDLRVSSESSCEANLAAMLQKLDIARVEYGGGAFGPLSCDFEARHLDALALSEFQSRLRLLAGASDVDVDALSAQVGELYVTLFGKLLAGKPELRISRLRLGTARGDLTGSLQVRSDAPAGQAAVNPLLLLPYVKAEAELIASEELLVGLLGLDVRNQDPAATDEAVDLLARQRFRDQIEPLLARGFLTRDGANITGRASLSQGHLTVNGQSTPLF